MLTPEKREVFHGWLRENLTLHQIVERLRNELGVITSDTSVSKYYQRWSQELLVVQGVSQSYAAAGGVEITISSQRPGEIKLAVKPLSPHEFLKQAPGGAAE